jgi:molybdopterin-guanine dinucleotide biosynthesis protein B
MKKYKQISVAFTGPSNEGKTTLVEKLSILLQKKGFKVAIVKHDPCDKAIFDKEGKDSDRYTKIGADVVVTSPTRTTLFKQEQKSIKEIANLFGEFDYMLVEGLKSIPLPRLCVCRKQINYQYFDVSDALLIDKNLNEKPNFTINSIDLENHEAIIEWIDANGIIL